MTIFQDWRILDQSPVGLYFDKRYIYYIHSRAWALKGWLGGTHSWFTFWSEIHERWLVLELTDTETINVQNASIYWIRDNVEYREHSPVISNRINDAKWFGSIPTIVGKAKLQVLYSDIERACAMYPHTQFDLIGHNCNTFASYILYKLNLEIPRPLRSIGFKNSRYWEKICMNKNL